MRRDTDVEWKIPIEQLYMYQMKKKPQKIPLNDYIVRYKQTGSEWFLQCFLHLYESRINRRTESFCLQYGQLHHFLDIKQTIIAAIMAKIEDYDPDAGASLITYTYKHIEAEVRDYIRKNCGAVNASEYDYDNLRNIMAINSSESGASEADRIQAAMDRTGLSEESVKQHLQYGELFLYTEDINSVHENDEDGDLQLIERIGNIHNSPEYIVYEKMLYEAIVTAVDSLPRKEKRLIFDYYGLERYDNRFRDIEPVSKEILAARLHIGKVQAVDENARRAVALLRSELEKANWIEGKNTPKVTKEPEANPHELTKNDCEIIEYAIYKWRESGKTAEFHILFHEELLDNSKMHQKFLKLWLY